MPRRARRRLATVLLAAAGCLAPACVPAADSKPDLDARCEAAREAALSPLRAARIADCKADRRNDPAFCERYWRDYGNGVRTRDGRWLPRLFDDLPECVAAHAARRGATR